MSRLATVVVFALIASVSTATTPMPAQNSAPTPAPKPAPVPSPKPAPTPTPTSAPTPPPTPAPTPKPTQSPAAVYNASVDAAHAAVGDLESETQKLSSRLNDEAAATAAGAAILRVGSNTHHALRDVERQEKDHVKALMSAVMEKCSDMDKLAPTDDQAQKQKSFQDYYRDKYDPKYTSGPSKAITSHARALDHEAERSIEQFYKKVKGQLNDASRTAKRAREEKEQEEENKQTLRAFSEQAKARAVSMAQTAADEARAAAEAAAQKESEDHAAIKKFAEQEAAAKKVSTQAAQRAASESKVAQEAAAKAATANSSAAAQDEAVASNARAASQQALQDQLSSQVAEAQAAQAAAQARLAGIADAADSGAKREAEAAAKKKLEAAEALDLLPDAAPAKPNDVDTPKLVADKSQEQGNANTRGAARLAGKMEATAEPLNAIRVSSFFVAGIAFVSLAAGLRASLRRTAPQLANFPNLG